MHQHIGNAFRKDKAASYRNHKNGFYVYAEPKECNPGEVIKYIGRYLGRPVIATSRIDKYDGENVTFHYNRHEDDVYVEETIPALDFIGRVIQHIPEALQDDSLLWALCKAQRIRQKTPQSHLTRKASYYAFFQSLANFYTFFFRL